MLIKLVDEKLIAIIFNLKRKYTAYTALDFYHCIAWIGVSSKMSWCDTFWKASHKMSTPELSYAEICRS
jgi:hypothetical protein